MRANIGVRLPGFTISDCAIHLAGYVTVATIIILRLAFMHKQCVFLPALLDNRPCFAYQ